MEIQQSPFYKKYIIKLGWNVVHHQGFIIFIKQFPLYGGLAKIQRITTLLNPDKLIPLLKKFRVRRIIVEPDANVLQRDFDQWVTQLSQSFTITTTPYLPTKTIRIDLKPSEDDIFHNFSEAKRRAVRRATRHHVLIKESSDIRVLITIKNKSSGFLGFITTYGIDKLWPIFAPDHAAILLAYQGKVIANPDVEEGRGNPQTVQRLLRRFTPRNDNKTVGGVLLIFWDSVAYYWIAGATREGKKLFSPTLLVWEALKLSKKRGMKQFDFVGVWDERSPKQFHEWKGFTKFKEGFGGKALYYPIVK
ncbi:peptidoglycan bridge formation glycyltransferase FemA/FemB family protein [Candidatus Gottesmanbacteria bacterium]|nr:peptidoglycan bridge formation glycyltransferase FemA/FemB family protein [Candidatus Gottesmanbacteria bacterium]